MAKRILKKVDVTHISLVNKGANQKTIIFKSADTTNPDLKIIPIAKVDEDQHTVYGLVYSPNDEDSQGDIASVEVIKEMAYEFMQKGQTNNVDKQHNFQSEEGFVAESWLTKANDPVFPDANVGSWAVAIKVEKEETWQTVKSGEITGLSLAGVAIVEEVEKSSSITKVIKSKIAGWLGIKKDFNSMQAKQEINSKMWILNDVIRNIFEDSAITDKQSAINESIDQFKANIASELETVDVTKAGKTISTANETKIKAAIAALNDLLNNNQTIQKEDNEMDANELKEAIEKAIKPIQDELATLKKANDDLTAKIEADSKAIAERVEKVEKASPGSTQAPTTKSDESKANNIWC